VRLADFDNDGVYEIVQAAGFTRGTVNRWPEMHELALGNDERMTDPRFYHPIQPGDDVAGGDHDPFFVRAKDGRYYDLAVRLGLGDRSPFARGIRRKICTQLLSASADNKASSFVLGINAGATPLLYGYSFQGAIVPHFVSVSRRTPREDGWGFDASGNLQVVRPRHRVELGLADCDDEVDVFSGDSPVATAAVKPPGDHEKKKRTRVVKLKGVAPGTTTVYATDEIGVIFDSLNVTVVADQFSRRVGSSTASVSPDARAEAQTMGLRDAVMLVNVLSLPIPWRIEWHRLRCNRVG
jgi:hypothetical protein